MKAPSKPKESLKFYIKTEEDLAKLIKRYKNGEIKIQEEHLYMDYISRDKVIPRQQLVDYLRELGPEVKRGELEDRVASYFKIQIKHIHSRKKVWFDQLCDGSVRLGDLLLPERTVKSEPYKYPSNRPWVKISYTDYDTRLASYYEKLAKYYEKIAAQQNGEKQ